MQELRPRQLEWDREQHRAWDALGGSAKPRTEAVLSVALDLPPRTGVGGHVLTASCLWRVTQAHPAHLRSREVSVSSRTL